MYSDGRLKVSNKLQYANALSLFHTPQEQITSFSSCRSSHILFSTPHLCKTFFSSDSYSLIGRKMEAAVVNAEKWKNAAGVLDLSSS